MARQTKAAATDDKTVEGVPHTHADETGKVPLDEHGKPKPHLHRLGDVSHLHREDGKAILLDDHGKPLFEGDDTELAPDPHGPSDALAAKAFPDHAQREEQRQDRDIQRRAEIAASVTAEDVRDMEAIRASHPDIITANGPRPVSVSGAPGSRLSDVASRAIHLTMDGYPSTVHDEVIWTEIATHALVSMREEQARTKGPADPALVAAALDAVMHVAKARGLA